MPINDIRFVEEYRKVIFINIKVKIVTTKILPIVKKYILRGNLIILFRKTARVIVTTIDIKIDTIIVTVGSAPNFNAMYEMGNIAIVIFATVSS